MRTKKRAATLARLKAAIRGLKAEVKYLELKLVHYGTVHARLKKIAELIGTTVDDPYVAESIEIALGYANSRVLREKKLEAELQQLHVKLREGPNRNEVPRSRTAPRR